MKRLLLALVFALSPLTARAQEEATPTYEQAMTGVRSNADCEFSTWPLYDIYLCREDLTVWYFARPEHQGYPGYVRRQMVRRDGGIYMVTTGHSDASDDRQAEFQEWMRQVGESLPR